MLIDKIKELNDSLYKAFGELAENIGHINSEEHRAGIAKNIYDLYELDYKLIRGSLYETDQQVAELERRKEIMTPRFFRKWWNIFRKRPNRAEEVLSAEAYLNAMQYFGKKQEMLDKLAKAIAEADEAPTGEALEEPKDTAEQEEESDEQGAAE